MIAPSLAAGPRGYAGPAGAQVHYQLQGHGAPLILLAPVPRSGSYFRALAACLGDFTTVAVDTPGFGRSDPLAPGFSMTDVADRALTVLDGLGLERAHVLGVHSGNKIAAALAASHPDRVAGFVFAGMTHSIVLDNAARATSMRGFYRSPDATPDPDMDHTDADGTAPRADQRWQHVWSVIDRLRGEADEPDDPGLAAARRVETRDRGIDELLGLEAFDGLYAANFRFDLAGALRAVDAPTLIAEFTVPEESHLDRQAPLISSMMRRVTAVTLAGDDRELLQRRPGPLAAAIRQFLGRVDGALSGCPQGRYAEGRRR